MHIEKIKGLFSEIDEESTGIITYQTFQRKMNLPEVRTYFETIDLDVWDAWGFFKLLDLDAGGSAWKRSGERMSKNATRFGHFCARSP